MSKVVIMIISNRTTWDAEFAYSLTSLIFNDRKHGLIQDVGRVSGQTIAQMRNRAVECARGKKATHLLMLDDDQVYPPDAIQRLLARKKPVVGGIYPARRAPWYLNIHVSREKAEGEHRSSSHRVFNIPGKGVFPVDVLGLGGALFDMTVFEKLEKPYFDSPVLENKEGMLGDEFYFAQKCREAGIQIWVDTELRYVHMVPTGVVYNSETGVQYVAPRQ